MADLRAGLLGLGMMGRHHARVLASLPTASSSSPSPTRPATRTASPATVPVLADVDELIARRHRLLRRRRADRRCHEDDRAGAGRGRRARPGREAAGPGRRRRPAARRGVRGRGPGRRASATSSGSTRRCRALRARLEAGELGEVYQIVTRRQGPFPARIADVGVVKDLATHDIDLTAWVTQSRSSSVSAHVAHRSGREHEDLVAVVGRLADGTVTSHLVNWLVAVQGAGHRRHRRARARSSPTRSAADLTFYANGTVADRVGRRSRTSAASARAT